MKIIVFGAAGGTGYKILEQVLDSGYQVTAFVLDSQKIKLNHKNLSIIQGDVLKSSIVEKAIIGHDAVICSLGMKNIMDKTELRSKGTKNIITAMKKAKIKRFICQSAFGSGNSYNLLPPLYKYFIVPAIMKRLFIDHNKQEEYIRSSDLDWTIVRPTTLTNTSITSTYQIKFNDNKNIKFKISRSDVAHFIVKQLENSSYIHKSPYISY